MSPTSDSPQAGSAERNSSASPIDPVAWMKPAIQVTAGVVAGWSAFTLLGWLYNGPAFLVLEPFVGLMRANTALGLLLASVALWVLAEPAPRPLSLGVSRLAATLAVLVGVGTLIGHIGPENWFDHLLLRGASAAHPPAVLRMGANSAVALLLTGFALLLTRSGAGRIAAAQAAAVGAVVAALFTVLGYAYGLIQIQHWFAGAGMSPQTALSLILLGFGVIACEPGRGLLGPLLKPSASGSTIRRLLPAVFLVLLTLGAVAVAIQRAELFPGGIVITSFALTSFLLVAVLVYWNAAALARVERLRAVAEGERREANARLAASEERFRLATKALRGWIYDTDLATGRTDRSEGFYAELGLTRAQAPESREWWLSCIHPEEADRCERRTREALALGRDSLTQEYRVRTADGRYIWIWDHVIIVREPDGRPVRMVGNVLDITARKSAEAAVLESEERFRNMADHSPGMVWLSDAAGSFTFLSQSWHALTGQTPQSALGLGWLEAVHAEERDVTRDILLAAASRRIPFRFDFRVHDREGDVRWLFLAASPRFGAEREFLGYVGSMMDITDRKSMEEELREADQRKDEFLAMLGHELRNPLAPIRSAAALMRHMQVEDPKFGWAREVIERQVAHMTRLIDDLLDVARITRGTVQLRCERVELDRIVGEAIEVSRPLIDDRAHRLDVELPEEQVWLDADPARLGQVLANVLNNAAKYMEQGGEIHVRARLRGAEVEICVSDTGVGIDPELLPRIFDLFTQGKQSIDRSQGGLGIGLTLAKALVELHGGSVQARSEGRGRGSEFIVTLPVAATGAVASSPLHELRGRVAVVPRRVLVVDDNVDSADGLATLLSIEGHHVATANDGPTALEKAHRFQPDIVLLDIGLPGMDGYEVARRMRSAPDLRSSRLVAITGYGGESDRQLSREAGFSDHLVKPVDAEALHGLINSLEAA